MVVIRNSFIFRATPKQPDLMQDDKWAVKVMADLSITDKEVMMSRIDWNVNKEMSKEILRAAEVYNVYGQIVTTI